MAVVVAVGVAVNRADPARNQVDFQVGATEQKSTEVGGHRATVKLCPDRKSGIEGKAKLSRARNAYGRFRFSF